MVQNRLGTAALDNLVLVKNYPAQFPLASQGVKLSQQRESKTCKKKIRIGALANSSNKNFPLKSSTPGNFHLHRKSPSRKFVNVCILANNKY